jgi:Holliday junction resolvase-like predicted endonuclease
MILFPCSGEDEMNAEKEIIASLLKLTKTAPVQKELIRKDARVSTEALEDVLQKLNEAGLINGKHNLVEASSNQRVNLAVHTLKLGADYEQTSKFLNWKEFEKIAAQAFEANGFGVLKNFHFKHLDKRWEMDILSCRKPLIVCVDCKHWKHGWSRASIIKVVGAQIERTRAFANSLPDYYQKVRLSDWKNATLVPLVLSLVSGPLKFYNNVAVVPVLQLQDFINVMPIEVQSLTHFNVNNVSLDRKLTDYSIQNAKNTNAHTQIIMDSSKIKNAIIHY